MRTPSSDRDAAITQHAACGGGHLHVCKWLVRECAMHPATAVQSDGRRPLHYAARNGRISVARWLVRDHAADANAASADGTVPLHWAVWRGELAMCKFLIHEAGADLSAVNKFGCNAIQWAAMTDGKNLRMCRWLQAQGLNLKIINCNGHSALHKAAVKGRHAVCEWLLRPDVDERYALVGVDEDIGGAGLLPQQHMLPDAEGNTPSELARLEGFDELAQWLRQRETTTKDGDMQPCGTVQDCDSFIRSMVNQCICTAVSNASQ